MNGVQFPAGWQSKRLKHVAHVTAGQSPESVNVTYSSEGLPFLQGCAEFGPKFPISNKFCSAPPKIATAGSWLISVRAPVGRLNPADQDYCIGRGLASVHAINVDHSYLGYVLVSKNGFFDAISTGSTFQAISTWQLENLELQLPPLKTQHRIAQFLDGKTAQIDGLIEKKRALLDRLAEKRQALITRAVTKGLNPDAPTKPSGLDWLGDIPAHWEVLPLKRRITQIEQGWSPAAEGRTAAPDEWGVLKSGCVNDGIFDEMSHKALPVDLDPKRQLEVKEGDILMCRASGSLRFIGSVALVEEVRSNLMFSDKTYRINLDTEQVDKRFFVYSMAAKHIRDQIFLSVSGAEGLANNIAQSSVGIYLHSFPPLPEQLAIAGYLAETIGRLEHINDSVEKSVSQLAEYRAALITTAVTGQLEIA